MGFRLDAIVNQLLDLNSRANASKLIENGYVSVNDVPVDKKSHKVQPNDTIAVQVPDQSHKQTFWLDENGNDRQRHYCIDVECVATGTGFADRAPARLVMVDQFERIVFDRHVRPELPIVSCLTALTGIEPHHLEDAQPLAAVVAELAAVLPPTALLVGQGILHDIHWLGLEAGVHYADHFDIAKLFAVQRANSGYMRYFSLRHEVLHLSGFEGAGTDIQSGVHDPAIDALYSIRLYNRYKDANEAELKFKRNSLLRAPPTPSFSKLHPVLDGVQMKAP